MGGMRVGIDCRSLRSGPLGIATYVKNLLEYIPFLECLDGKRPSNNFLWNQFLVPSAQVRKGWDVYHAPSYTAPLVNFCPLVLTVADISYLVRREWYPYHLDPVRKSFYVASIKRADRILVPTDFTKDELVHCFPGFESKVIRVHLGVSRDFRKDNEWARKVRQKLGLPSQFILHVGDIHPRRNLELLARVASKIDLPLVLVGRILRGGEAFSRWPYRYSGLSREQLVGVFSAATVFVYPSLYEGFGLPILEAMACEIPVVAAKCSCLPEVCGDAAILVDPDPMSLERGIEQAMAEREDFVTRGVERARSFSWEQTARETVSVYRQLLL